MMIKYRHEFNFLAQDPHIRINNFNLLNGFAVLDGGIKGVDPVLEAGKVIDLGVG
jgi:hypothetical protein